MSGGGSWRRPSMNVAVSGLDTVICKLPFWTSVHSAGIDKGPDADGTRLERAQFKCDLFAFSAYAFIQTNHTLGSNVCRDTCAAASRYVADLQTRGLPF